MCVSVATNASALVALESRERKIIRVMKMLIHRKVMFCNLSRMNLITFLNKKEGNKLKSDKILRDLDKPYKRK